MKSLARVVHNLVTGEQVSRVDLPFNLPRLEREALRDLQSLLRRPPRDLAAFLAQGQWPEPWLSLPLSACD
jgi:hypothetical protein